MLKHFFSKEKQPSQKQSESHNENVEYAFYRQNTQLQRTCSVSRVVYAFEESPKTKFKHTKHDNSKLNLFKSYQILL